MADDHERRISSSETRIDGIEDRMDDFHDYFSKIFSETGAIKTGLALVISNQNDSKEYQKRCDIDRSNQDKRITATEGSLGRISKIATGCALVASFIITSTIGVGEEVNPSQNCLDLIKSFEGFRANVNKDPIGLLEVGYGHKLLPGESFPDGVDVASATELLENDLMPVVSTINSLVKSPLTQNEFDALCCLTYNIGCGAFRNSTLLKYLNAGNFDRASAEFLRWDRAGGEVLDGLLKRRLAEQKLFLT